MSDLKSSWELAAKPPEPDFSRREVGQFKLKKNTKYLLVREDGKVPNQRIKMLPLLCLAIVIFLLLKIFYFENKFSTIFFGKHLQPLHIDPCKKEWALKIRKKTNMYVENPNDFLVCLNLLKVFTGVFHSRCMEMPRYLLNLAVVTRIERKNKLSLSLSLRHSFLKKTRMPCSDIICFKKH
ncbi:hypothetical protein M5K25_027951 [Dendrobium thyrsiflorum]|uniref:Uncharacterized protein n=1 Tax=Dendrobium thyrsiflorum TaxID=117978 RepID=A0ABD0TV85_DENTH